MISNNAFEELNHDNNENQQTEVKNNDLEDAVNVKRPSIRQVGILLNLFPIKTLLKQCKRLSQRNNNCCTKRQ